MDDILKDISVTLPFAFSIFAIATGTWEHIQKNRDARKVRRRNELVLELIRLVRTTADPLEAIKLFQKRTSELVLATKSRTMVV